MSAADTLDFVPARLPEAVNIKPGAYEIIQGQDSTSSSDADSDRAAAAARRRGPAGRATAPQLRSSSPSSDSDETDDEDFQATRQGGDADDGDDDDTTTTTSESASAGESDSDSESDAPQRNADAEDDDDDAEDEKLRIAFRLPQVQGRAAVARSEGQALRRESAPPSEESEDDDDDDDARGAAADREGPASESALVPAGAAADANALKFVDLNANPNDRGSRDGSRIFKSWKPSARAPVGLENRGVTCYMNAAIQSLFHLPAVGRYLTEVATKQPENIKRSSVTADLAALFERATEARKAHVYPAKIIRRLGDINCMMSQWEQEDSHEYLMSLLSRLQEDSVPKGQKLASSILHEMFGGTLEQRVTCRSCGHVSTTNQHFYDLPVSLSASEAATERYTLKQSIEDFFATEELVPRGKDGYQCENCKKVTKAWKQNKIVDAPEYLTVHIKRFKFEGASGQKVKDPLAYTIDLDLDEFSKTHEPLRYKLASVIVHEGRTLTNGHYIALCRQPNNDWMEYDDDILRRVSEKSVRKNTGAYILIYSRLKQKAPTVPAPAPAPAALPVPAPAPSAPTLRTKTKTGQPVRSAQAAAPTPAKPAKTTKAAKAAAKAKADAAKVKAEAKTPKPEKTPLTRAQLSAQQLAHKKRLADDIDSIFGTKKHRA